MPAWLLAVWSWIITKLGKTPATPVVTQTEHEPTVPVEVNVTVNEAKPADTAVETPSSVEPDVPVVKTAPPVVTVITPATTVAPTPAETSTVEVNKN